MQQDNVVFFPQSYYFIVRFLLWFAERVVQAFGEGLVQFETSHFHIVCLQHSALHERRNASRRITKLFLEQMALYWLQQREVFQGRGTFDACHIKKSKERLALTFRTL